MSSNVRQRIGETPITSSMLGKHARFGESFGHAVDSNKTGIKKEMASLRKEKGRDLAAIEEGLVILLYQMSAADAERIPSVALHLITEGLKAILGTKLEKIRVLVPHAEAILRNKVISTTKYFEALAFLAHEEKERLAILSDDIIRSLGDSASLAHFYHQKFKDSLS